MDYTRRDIVKLALASFATESVLAKADGTSDSSGIGPQDGTLMRRAGARSAKSMFQAQKRKTGFGDLTPGSMLPWKLLDFRED